MAGQNWGECKGCRHFEIEPNAQAESNTMGLCISQPLETYHLRVSGSCGCNSFENGESAHATGASEAPPRVAPIQ